MQESMRQPRAIGVSVRDGDRLDAPARDGRSLGLAEVSVVIPAYYRRDSLYELLKSLKEQTLKPMEIVVVDDTPTADIKRLCQEYEMEFVDFGVTLIYIKNLGERAIAIARNLGARIAKEAIVAFIDSDVVLYSDYIQQITEAFKKYPEAVGIAGWIVHPKLGHQGIRYRIFESLKRLFLLFHGSRDSCKHFEYPHILTRTIYCSWLSCTGVAYRRGVFDEFTFDENLKKYSFMEDFLFSSEIHKRYPHGLMMTPSARMVHRDVEEGRGAGSQLAQIKLRNRKYVLTKLWGCKGVLMFGWQNLGLVVLRSLSKIRHFRYSPLEQ